MGLFKKLAIGVGAIVLAPVALPAAAAVGAAGLAAGGAALGAAAAAAGTATAAVGGVATAAGAAIAGSAVGTAATAAGTAIAGSAVGAAATGAMTAVGTAVGGAAGAVGLSSIATVAGTSTGAAALGTITTATTIGASGAISGAGKMLEASDLKEKAEQKYNSARAKFDKVEASVNADLENLGKLKVNIWDGFSRYITAFEKIHNIEEIDEKLKLDGKLKFDKNELAEINVLTVSARDLMKDGVVSAAGGQLIGLATSAGFTSVATASTGTAIASLHGAAATNAALAALGGGALDVGGLGMAGGAIVANALAFAPAIAIGGLFLNGHGKKSLEAAKDIESESNKLIKELNVARNELMKLEKLSGEMTEKLKKFQILFNRWVDWLEKMVERKTDFRKYSREEQLKTFTSGQLASILKDLTLTQLLSEKTDGKDSRVEESKVHKKFDDKDKEWESWNKKCNVCLGTSETGKDTTKTTLGDIAKMCSSNNKFDVWVEMYRQKCTVDDILNMNCNEARSWCTKNADLPKKIEEKAIEAGKGKTVSYYGKARRGMICALAAFRSMVIDDKKGFRTWSREYRLLETSIRFFFGKDRYGSYNDFTDSEVPHLKDYLDFDNSHGNIVTNEILEEAFCKVQGNSPLFRLEVDIEKNKFSINHIIESEKNTAKIVENDSEIKLAGGARLIK